jgi:hypothetical protein
MGEWTTERRQAARERALESKLWRASTGPRTEEGKRAASRNAGKGLGHEAGGFYDLLSQIKRGLKELEVPI